ncbi:MAG: D-amino acid dehydrogenase [Alphaproteobacteria bacterium]|nr:D-amino acid dehydrogenase [Alphaproteobacteria bacterium]
MKILVLGAGVIGVTSAYYLAEDGHEVTVIEKREGPGLETSFANGGQISASHSYPWSAPDAPWKIAGWIGRKGAPLRFSPRLDPDQWSWAIRFLINCRQGKFLRNSLRNLSLALASRVALGDLREETGIDYDQKQLGILHFFRHQGPFESAKSLAERFRDWGCESRVVDTDECIKIEPALAAQESRILGGIHTPGDESGDAYLFTKRLTTVCRSRGVTFRFGETVLAMEQEGNRVSGIRTASATYRADAYVIALGCQSAKTLRPLGIRLPVYPVKGYSITVPVEDHSAAPSVSLIDEEHKIVYSRLGDRLRAAGTAHLAGYDAAIDPARATALLEIVRSQFPGAGAFERAEFWAGLRPMTPDGCPVIGSTPYQNLYLNTGHGTLGWTMCCGSGRLLADLIAGRTPAVNPEDYALTGRG